MISQLSTDLSEEQWAIIESKAIGGIQRTQLESFARYLNLPWGDLEAFTTIVKLYEDEFQEELSHIDSSNHTKFYLENYPFHIFNHPVSESPAELRIKLNIQFFLEPAIELLHQKNWSDLKNHEGRRIDYYKTNLFLWEITIRIFNWNVLIPKVMPLGHIGEALRDSCQIKSNTFLPNCDATTFKMESVEDFSTSRFELYLIYFKPQIVASSRSQSKSSALRYKFNRDAAPTSTFNIGDILKSMVLSKVKKIFDDVILPNIEGGSEFILSDHTVRYDSGPEPLHFVPALDKPYAKKNKNEKRDRSRSPQRRLNNTDPNDDSDSKVKNLNKRDESQTFTNFLNEKFLSNDGRSFQAIEVHPRRRDKCLKNRFVNMNEVCHTLCSISIKFESDLVELATEYFQQVAKEQDSHTYQFCVDENSDKRRKIHREKNVNQNELMKWSIDSITVGSNTDTHMKRIEYEGQQIQSSHEREANFRHFSRFIEEAITSAQKYGTPLSVITNGDDFIIMYIDKFYQRVKLNDKSVFSDWKVLIINRDKHPLVAIFSSIVLSVFKDYLTSGQMTNSEVTNWYQTFGSCERKKVLDMYRYLIMRKLFIMLWSDKSIAKLAKPSLDLLKFSWFRNGELHKLLGSGRETSKSLNEFIKDTSKIILESPSWNILKLLVKQKDFSPLKIELVESTDFTFLQTLQNETWCEEVSARIIRARYCDNSEGIVKFLDINRLNIDNDWFVQLKNEDYFMPSLKNLFYYCYRSFINEFIAYSLIGEKDFIPKVLKCGFLYMSNLKPTSSSNDMDLYEDPFIYHLKGGVENKVKTESLFLYLENIPKAKIEDIIANPIDFKKLEKQACEDLDRIHKVGIYLRCISQDSIIIKKSDKSEIGYRVVFVGFGLSTVYGVKKDAEEKVISKPKDWYYYTGQKERDQKNLKDAIDRYRYDVERLIGKKD